LLDPLEKELKIYQSTGEGIFVKNLQKVFCNDYSQVEKAFTDGKKMRVVGATQMNKTSSWSHAVFTLYTSLKEVEAGGKKS